ncbi:hypothetical protein, partial [Pseudoalteromonas sp. S981]|uniref:hypothetical protein n=1 Tax=Pseudoalteromonas sp. S981 TaxID=579569 RepID=UPI00110CE421
MMNKNNKTFVLLGALTLISQGVMANVMQTKGNFEDKFRQLDESLPTANSYRSAAGAPGEN